MNGPIDFNIITFDCILDFLLTHLIKQKGKMMIRLIYSLKKNVYTVMVNNKFHQYQQNDQPPLTSNQWT